MADVLIDTDVWIDHLRGHRRIREAGRHLYLSSVTRAELFAGVADGAEGELAVRQLLSVAIEVPVDARVAELGGQLRREHRMGLAEALIAASALAVGARLETRNRRHFAGVPALRVVTPR